MFKFTKCDYNDIFKTASERYDNGKYHVVFEWRLDENGNPYRRNDPNDLKNVMISVIPNNMLDGVRVGYSIVKLGEKEARTNKLFIVGERREHFRDLYGATGVWKDGAEALIDLDELIRKKFPGYYITDKREY